MVRVSCIIEKTKIIYITQLFPHGNKDWFLTSLELNDCESEFENTLKIAHITIASTLFYCSVY